MLMAGPLPRIARRLILSALLLCAAMAGASVWGQGADTLVLNDVTVIDGTGAAPRSGMTIVIRDGRIAELFPTSERSAPAGATRLDDVGRFVIPGLIDAHVHLATTERPAAVLASLMQATLLGGVTSVRDMGGNGDVVSGLARVAEAPGALSPAIYASAVFAGAESFWFTDGRASWFRGGRALNATPWLVRVDRSADLRGAVRRAKAWGARGVKMYSHLTPGQMNTIADAARREGLAVWSHATVIPARPDAAVAARVNSISHADYLAWEGKTGVRADLVRPSGRHAGGDGRGSAGRAGGPRTPDAHARAGRHARADAVHRRAGGVIRGRGPSSDRSAGGVRSGRHGGGQCRGRRDCCGH